jgi:hypothetical protein
MAGGDNEVPLLPLAEAAARIGRHPEALRSVIRRGRLEAVRGNDGRLLVRLPADPRQGVDRVTTEEAAAEADLVTELQAEVAEPRVAVARLEAGREAAERARVTEPAAKGTLVEELRGRAERAEADAARLRGELAEVRRPWLARVIKGLRREG